jgi:hypothetical protein
MKLSRAIRLVLGGALLALVPWATAAPATASVPGMGTWQTELQPRDLNRDGIVDAWYDTSQDLTWLAKVSPLGDQASWQETLSYIDHLALGGYQDWRLPIMAPANGTSWIRDFSWNGDTDYGYNNTRTEFGHLFYVTLGNKAPCAPGSIVEEQLCIDPWPASPGDRRNTGPFELTLPPWQNGSFWMSIANGGYAAADFNGFQIVCSLCDNTISLGAGFFVVRNGDVQVPAIPEPGVGWLALSGVVVMALVRRRRRTG